MSDDYGFTVDIRAELDRFERNMRDAGRLVDSTTTSMDKATKRAANSFNRLEAAFDPVSKAATRLERDQQRVQAALDRGAVSSDRAARVMQSLNAQYEASVARARGAANGLDQVAASAGRFNASAQAGSRMSGQFGTAIQQAGYQVGDFAVQVSSGQGVLRPFIQQGTQLVSMFGPMGAVVGAAGAVVGAFATSLLEAGDAADDAAKKETSFTEAVRLSQELTGKAAESALYLANARYELAKKSRADAVETERQNVAAIQRQVIEAQNAAKALAETLKIPAQGFLAENLPGESVFERIAREGPQASDASKALAADLKAARTALAEAEVRLAELEQGVGEFDTSTKAASAATKEFDSNLATLQGQLFPAQKAADDYREDQDLLAKAFHQGSMELDAYTLALTRLKREYEASISDSALNMDPLSGGLRQSLSRYGDEASKVYLEAEEKRLKASKDALGEYEEEYTKTIQRIADRSATPFVETPAHALDDPEITTALKELEA